MSYLADFSGHFFCEGICKLLSQIYVDDGDLRGPYLVFWRDSLIFLELVLNADS